MGLTPRGCLGGWPFCDNMNTFLTFLVMGAWACARMEAAEGPLQVYILAGQSNMQGQAKISTFEHIGMDPATQPMLGEMLGADGKPRVCEGVWIAAVGGAEAEQTGKLTAGFGASADKIGPEFTFGIYMEKVAEGPILIIKTAWGGKSLNTDFRSPGAGPYPFSEAQLAGLAKQGRDLEVVKAEKAKETGVSYGLMMAQVKAVLGDIKRVVPNYDAARGYALAGFVWFQGWNDMVDGGSYPNRDQVGGYDAYSGALVHLIRDVRRDLGAAQLPFVIGVLGVGGPTAAYGPEQLRYKATHDHFREAMAAPAEMAEFKGSVAAVRTEVYWDQELSAAKAKLSAIQGKAKKLAAEGKLGPEDERVLLEKLRAEGLSERERVVMEKGISNLEFHYLGSAKIIGGIGKGFAEAMAELKHLPKP